LAAWVIARTNPAAQAPDTRRTVAALRSVPFKVFLGHFLTDTAELADLILPATTFLEEEDVYVSSWTTYLGHAPAVVAPPGECRTEQEMYRGLAERLAMDEAAAELARPAREWLIRALAPLGDGEALYARLAAGEAVRHPEAPPVAFADRRFPTPSGRVELWSERAVAAGLDPLGGVAWPWPGFDAAGHAVPPGPEETAYPYRLLSPQPRHRLHSTFGNLPEPGAEGEARLHPATAAAAGLADGERAKVSSPVGELETRVKYDPGVQEGVVVIPNGVWRRRGGSVNELVPMGLSDMGEQASLYEARCQLGKAR
jgi:anaerobic selenocysteine-containing dehydrogenase